MGGKTNGRCKNPSTSDFPQNFLRAKNQPTATASGNVTREQITATLNDNCIADHSLAVYLKSSINRKSVFNPNFSRSVRS